jgi:hypothetical protein
VLGAECALAQLDRAARVRLARGVTAARVLKPAEVVVDGCPLDGLGAERAFEDREGAAVERLGLLEAAVELVEHAEVVQRAGRFYAVGAERLFGEGDGTLDEGLGLFVAPEDAADAAEVGKSLEAEPAHVLVVGVGVRVHDGRGARVCGFGPGVVAALLADGAEA